jgi:hypothetical protein
MHFHMGDDMTPDETANLKEEILDLHRQLAAETLRANQGWERYESANADRNALRAELVREKERLHTIIGLSAPLSVDGKSVFIDGTGMVPLDFGVQPKLVLALPIYEKRRIVIASDEVIDGERLVCVAIKDA